MHDKEHSDKLHHHVVKLLHHVMSQCIMRAAGGITGASLTSLSEHQDWSLQPIPVHPSFLAHLHYNALPHLNSKIKAYFNLIYIPKCPWLFINPFHIYFTWDLFLLLHWILLYPLFALWVREDCEFICAMYLASMAYQTIKMIWQNIEINIVAF